MKTDLVLVHGWGAHGLVWGAPPAHPAANLNIIAPDLPGHGRAPALASCTLEHMVAHLAATAPAQCAVAGWSLGGQLALAWAHRFPRQVSRVILIASTPCFVNVPDWAHGMAPEAFDAFSAALATDSGAGLRRFLLLQAQGDQQAKTVTRRLEATLALRPRPADEILRLTLRWLQTTDLRPLLPAIRQPVLVLHGDRDRIAPPAAGAYLAAQLPDASLSLMTGAAHAPFISDPETVFRLMADFCNARQTVD